MDAHKVMAGIASSLMAIDATVGKAHNISEPGGGLLYLLNHVAVGGLGVARTVAQAIEAGDGPEPMPPPVDVTPQIDDVRGVANAAHAYAGEAHDRIDKLERELGTAQEPSPADDRNPNA